LRRMVLPLLFLLSYTLAAQMPLARQAAREALTALSSGDLVFSTRMAETALQYEPRYSDPYLVYALIAEKERENLGSSYWAEKALEINVFLETSPVDALRLQAQYWNRNSQPEKAELLLASRPETAFHAVLASLRIEALLLTGRREAASRLLSQARERFPADRSLVFSLLQYPRTFPETEARLLEAMNDPSWVKGNWNRVLSFLPAEPLDQAWVLTRLQKSPRAQDPDLAGRMLTARLMDWPRALEVWKTHGLPTDFTLLVGLSRLVPRPLQPEWDALISNMTGIFIEDRDKNSYPDFFWTFNRGMLQKIEGDKDQDGKPESSLSFEQSLPREWKETLYNDQGRRVVETRLTWRRYPAMEVFSVEELSINPGPVTTQRKKVFSFVPDGTLVPIAQNLTSARNFAWPMADLREIKPPLETVLVKAVRMEEFDSQNRLRRRWSMENGEVYMMEADSRGNGYRDEVYLFKNGKLDRVFRDPSRMGRWTILERFVNGVSSMVSSSAEGLELVWLNLQPELFIWKNRDDPRLFSNFRSGILGAQLKIWNNESLPLSMPQLPAPPFTNLGSWP